MRYTESEILELKRSTSELKEGIISIVSILNKHHAGELIFGITSKGIVKGQEVSEKTIRGISQKISNSIEPKIYPQINKSVINGSDCIIVRFVGDELLYYVNGKAYLRVGDEDLQMSSKEIEKRILNKINLKWDSKISKSSVKNVDELLLQTYIKDSMNSGRISFDYTTKEKVLQKLELIDDGKLLNAGNILFCANSLLEVQTAVFAGKDKITFLDINNLEGSLLKMLFYSENYIKEHINWRADLSAGTRKEIPEIPIRAINEALVNSFCHRDYQILESNKIAIYTDRIDIWNPGNFTSEMNPLDFVKCELPSVLRNPKIARLLYYNEKIEKWGSGLKRIYEECKKYNVKVEFKNVGHGFSVIFYRRKSNANPKKIKHKSEANPKQIRSKSEANPNTFEDRLKWIIVVLNKNGKIKSKDIESKFGVHRDTVIEDLKSLKDQIVKKGAGSNVWYELKEGNNEN